MLKKVWKKDKMYTNNILCLKTIIKFCKRTKAKLIHISSTSVYGKQSKVVDENCEENILNHSLLMLILSLLKKKMLKKRVGI